MLQLVCNLDSSFVLSRYHRYDGTGTLESVQPALLQSTAEPVGQSKKFLTAFKIIVEDIQSRFDSRQKKRWDGGSEDERATVIDQEFDQKSGAGDECAKETEGFPQGRNNCQGLFFDGKMFAQA